MAQIRHKKITLYEEAKAGLVSLVQQTALVFTGIVVMLLITGGVPSSFIVASSFCLGTAFVAWSEQKRVTKMRVPLSNDSSEVLINNYIIHQPLQFRNLIVKNRVFCSDIPIWFDNYYDSDKLTQSNWEEKFAQGGVGAIISSFVPIPSPKEDQR